MDISDVGMERKADERAEDGGMKPFLPFYALHEETDDATEAESASLKGVLEILCQSINLTMRGLTYERQVRF